MKRIPVLTSALLLVGFFVTSVCAHAPDFVSLAKKMKPSVVNISTSKKVVSQDMSRWQGRGGQDLFEEFFRHFAPDMQPRKRMETSLGSGFIISDDGFILTNEHVVNGADEVVVKLSDGRTFDAKVRGADEKLDLALLKIETGGKLPVAELGDSENVQVGEWVMAIGNPFGLEQTVTAGIVSAKGRVIGAGPYDDFIQTDASINPGNSGGPLFNVRGEVVGINTAIIKGGQGIGFALPINAARTTVEQLKETGEVVRGWLGVSIQLISEELAKSFGLDRARGALVAEVMAGSPAEAAAIQRGDIILKFNGRDVDEMNDLPRLVASTRVGTSVSVVLFRSGRELTVRVEVGRLAADEGAPQGISEAEDRLGLTLRPLTPELQDRYGLSAEAGVVISGIDPDGPSAAANLQVGDLIIDINGHPVKGIKLLRKMVRGYDAGTIVRLLVQRGESSLYTTVKIK
ncbi:MAG: peptidase [Desulfuromonas sp.]|nr:MAG: peptidase [Desulfuromonas sp.]